MANAAVDLDRIEGAIVRPCRELSHVIPVVRRGRSKLRRAYKILYSLKLEKRVRFCGSALADLQAFPVKARKEAGRQIRLVQGGQDPDDWKPVNPVGPGTREIRIRESGKAYRVLYVAAFRDAIYVLHCFQKKTEKIPFADMSLAARRYRDIRNQE
ncbi:phage-related protein [Paraburkholderia bannensis]|uniref:Phage-related protein n=1 Tax=Paraburkholderia bannensis TaxID=765414 RepID=A0A7W9TTR3_9BURK|nr:type II toxin-antitoxin system RelE/ParE family toxin [Paraburkholderia bannensis]MBB3256326.1 phage-related protein [Paraburkholderia sp. WP4_3_2]MBB6101326.1 phage-related protein [Paraburkholderia bannensis]